MNILCIDYALSNFHNLVELAHDGHKVYMTSPHEEVSRSYYESLGVTILDVETSTRQSYLRKFLEDNKIDTILSLNPHYHMPDDWREEYNVIGLNEYSSHLETRKLWCRREVEKLGIRVPKLLDQVEIPCVVKPKKNHCSSVVLDDRSLQYAKDVTHPHYIEEYIHGVETNIDFVVSGNKWSISHVQQSKGEDRSKLAGNLVHYSKFVKYLEVSDDDRFLALDESEKILDWVATLGGSFQGQITGIIKDGEFYFIEINSRLGQTNSIPIFVRGNEYLESLDGNPDLLGDAIYNADMQKMVVHPVTSDAIYPFNLHEKYGVSIPCGLDIIDGEYRMCKQYRDKSAGIIIVDDHIPTDFVKELKNNSEFIVSH